MGKIGYTAVVRTKDERINIRISPKTKIELEAVAELRGTSMSGVIHQAIVRAIRDERAADPKVFQSVVDRITEYRLITNEGQEDSEEVPIFENVRITPPNSL